MQATCICREHSYEYSKTRITSRLILRIRIGGTVSAIGVRAVVEHHRSVGRVAFLVRLLGLFVCRSVSVHSRTDGCHATA